MDAQRLTFEQGDIFKPILQGALAVQQKSQIWAARQRGLSPGTFNQYVAGINRWPFKHYKELVELLHLHSAIEKVGLPPIN